MAPTRQHEVAIQIIQISKMCALNGRCSLDRLSARCVHSFFRFFCCLFFACVGNAFRGGTIDLVLLFICIRSIYLNGAILALQYFPFERSQTKIYTPASRYSDGLYYSDFIFPCGLQFREGCLGVF